MRLTVYWKPEVGGKMSIHDGIETIEVNPESDWFSGFDSNGKEVFAGRLKAIYAWEHTEVMLPFPGEMIPVPGPHFTEKRP